MKILLYGEAQNFASGAWCYAETLRDMGHSIVCFSDQEALGMYYSGVVWRAYRKFTGRLWAPHQRRHACALMDLVRHENPELIIVLKGLHLSRDDVLTLRQTGAFVVNINHDDFFSGNPNNWSRLQRNAICAYNYILTTREVNVAEIRPLNPRVEFFQFAYYPRIHRPLHIPSPERTKWCVDVVFIGTWERTRAQLLEILATRVEARYAIYGSQWQKLPNGHPLKKHVHLGEIVGDDLAKAIGGAKIALGFLRRENRDDYTQRTFEIPACNGVFLAERTTRHQSFYKEDVEAAFFDPGHPDELCRKVRYLLDHEQEREDMRRAGHQALLRQRHTYRDRMLRLLELFSLNRPSVKEA